MGIIMDILFGRKLTTDEIQKRENEYWNKVNLDRKKSINYMVQSFEKAKLMLEEANLIDTWTQKLELAISKINKLEREFEIEEISSEYSHKIRELTHELTMSSLTLSSNYNPKYFPNLKKNISEEKNQLNNMIEEDFKAEEFKDIKSKEIDNELSLLEQRKAELEARIALKKAEKEQYKG